MTNVYKIGVSIAMTNGISPVLGVIARDMLGIEGKLGKLESGFSRVKLAVGGAIAIAGGLALLAGMNKTLDAAKDLTREQGKMLAAGIANRDVAQATAKAWTISGKVLGTSVAENLAAISHLRAVFGDLPEAMKLAPNYQRNSVALGAITGKDGEEQNYKLARVIHMSGGAVDPTTGKLDGERFARLNKVYTAMIAAGGGKLDAGALLTFQQNAGSYGASLTEQGRINMVGAIQAMGGRAGTQLSSLNRALKDGVLQKSTLGQLEGIGLIDPSKVRKSAGNAGHGNGASAGGGISFMPGALKNEDQFRADTPGWVWNTLVPLLREKGLTTANDQVNWIQHAKLTTNPTRLLSELIRNQPVDQQEAKNVGQALKADPYNAAQAGLEQNQKNLHLAFKNMMTAFAIPLVKPAIAAMQAITGAVTGITAWATIHPATVKLIGGAIVVLGAALIGFGVVAIGVAAFAAVAAGGTVGLVIAGISAVVGGIAALVALNWNAIKTAANAFGDFIGKIVSVVGYILAHPFQAIRGILPQGERKVSAAEAAQLNRSPFNNVKPGQSIFDLNPNGFPSAVPPKAANQNVTVHTSVKIGSKEIAAAVSKVQADTFGANSGGMGRFDPAAALPSVGAGYAR
jgi:hypothetical protein